MKKIETYKVDDGKSVYYRVKISELFAALGDDIIDVLISRSKKRSDRLYFEGRKEFFDKHKKEDLSIYTIDLTKNDIKLLTKIWNWNKS